MPVDPYQRQWDAYVARAEVPRRWRIGLTVVVVVPLALAVAGFTVLKPVVREWRCGPTVSGPVITTVVRGDSRPSAIVRGPLTERAGCLFVAGTPVFWPHGTRWDDAREEVVFDDGIRTAVGGYFDGGGGGVDVRSIAPGVSRTGATRLARCARLSGQRTVYFAYHG